MADSRYCPAIGLGAEENHEQCVSVMRAKHLVTTSPDLYRYTFLPSVRGVLQLLLSYRWNNETIFECLYKLHLFQSAVFW
jgi:hypothetical protein